MAKDEERPVYQEMNLLLFQEKFSTENACLEFLFQSRWPKGFQCPRCGHCSYSHVSSRRLYQCSKCRKQTSVTAGTIFHRTKTPLRIWFLLLFRMATSKTGVSIKEMQRELGIKDYKTVWVMAHKIRKAMQERDSHYRLAGLVEMDESFFGPTVPGKRGRVAEGKVAVVIAVSIGTNRKGKEAPSFAHARVVPDTTAATIKEVLKEVGASNTERQTLLDQLRTDGWRSYQRATKDFGMVHHRLVLTNPRDSMKVLPWTHRFIAHVKAVVGGPHRGVSQKHLQKYLSEICYRFNRRYWPQQSFHRLVRACMTTTSVTRNELMAPTEAEACQ